MAQGNDGISWPEGFHQWFSNETQLKSRWRGFHFTIKAFWHVEEKKIIKKIAATSHLDLVLTCILSLGCEKNSVIPVVAMYAQPGLCWANSDTVFWEIVLRKGKISFDHIHTHTLVRAHIHTHTVTNRHCVPCLSSVLTVWFHLSILQT